MRIGELRVRTMPSVMSAMASFFLGVAGLGRRARSINQDKTIRIAYREDVPPFSYKDKIGEPVGFMVALCRESRKSSRSRRASTGPLNVTDVSVSGPIGSRPIRQQRADLLCEPTSATFGSPRAGRFLDPRPSSTARA